MNTAAVSTDAPTRPLPSRLAKDRLSTSIHGRTLAAGAFFDETAVAALGGALVVGLLGFLFDTVWAVDVPDALLVGEPTLGRLALFALVVPMVIGLSFKGLGYALDALAEALERRGFRRLVYVRDRLNRTIGVLWVNAEGSMHRIDGPALVSLTEKDCEVWIAVDGKRCAEGVEEILALQCAAKGLPRVDPENRQAVDWLTHRRAYGEPLPALPVTAVIGALTLHPNP